jgi:hypothetical protein
MQEESKRYDPIELIVKEIEAMAVGKHSDGTDLRTPTWKSMFVDDEVTEQQVCT